MERKISLDKKEQFNDLSNLQQTFEILELDLIIRYCLNLRLRLYILKLVIGED